MATRPMPKAAKRAEWKKNPYLVFESEKMRCTICCKYENKIKSCKNFKDTFIVGSDDFRLSAVKISRHDCYAQKIH